MRRAFDVYTAALRLESGERPRGAGCRRVGLCPGQLRDRPTLLRAGCGRRAYQHTRARAARGRHRGDRPQSVRTRAQRPGTGTPRDASRSRPRRSGSRRAPTRWAPPFRTSPPPGESPGARPAGIGGGARNPAETPTEAGRDELQDLAAGAQALAPQAQPIAIARDPDLLDQVMDLVFRVEETTAAPVR